MCFSICQRDSHEDVRPAELKRATVFLQGPTVPRINFRQLVLFSTILFLLFPCLAAAQPLTIVTDPYPPLGYVDKNGEIVGFTVDVIKLLLAQTGIEGQFKMYPWARAYEMALKEKDILIYQLSYSKERSNLFNLVGPILHESEYLFKLKNRKNVVVKNLDDAKLFRVGTVRNYHHHTFLMERGFEEGKNLEATQGDDQNIKKLVSKRIDLMITSEISFSYRLKELGYNRDDFEATIVVISEDSYIAFSRQTSPSVVAQFVEALEAIKKDGSYDGILKKYGVGNPGHNTVESSSKP